PQEQAEAALQSALMIRRWLAQEKPPAPRDKEVFAELERCYRVVIDKGTGAERELACNNLGVLYLNQKRYPEAVQVFRTIGRPTNPDAARYHYNFGRALIQVAAPDGSFEQSRLALALEPTYELAAVQACAVLL